MEGNHPHRRAHHIDIDGLSSWVVSDDDFVATEAVGKAVNKRLHEPRVSSTMCLMNGVMIVDEEDKMMLLPQPRPTIV
jgi:hypothetical protein